MLEEWEKEFRRRERKAAEGVLERDLNSGLEGMGVDDLEEQLKNQGFSEGVIKAAVDRLWDENQISVEEEMAISKGAPPAKGEAYPGDDVHDFFVEDVYRG